LRYCQHLLHNRDRAEWLTAALFPGKSDRTSNISYETQAAELKSMLKKVGLTYSKLTHIFRSGGARHLDSAGMDDTVGTGEESWHGLLGWQWLAASLAGWLVGSAGWLAVGCQPARIELLTIAQC
jgi:hypothetical protein